VFLAFVGRVPLTRTSGGNKAYEDENREGRAHEAADRGEPNGLDKEAGRAAMRHGQRTYRHSWRTVNCFVQKKK